MRETPQAFVKAFAKHGSVKAVARQSGLSYFKAQRLYKKAVAEGLMAPVRMGRKTRDDTKKPEPTGTLRARSARKWALPPAGEVNRYLFTCAQNDTLLHEPLWQNLQALMEHWRETSHHVILNVARTTYMKIGLGAAGDKGKITETLYGGRDLTWDARLEPYFCDDRVEVAPGLVWCGEVNIIPTAMRPLSGLESYTGRKSGIFPHTKFAMDSIPSMANEGTKFNYTTGSITLRNHIQRKAGLKADFHHCYGALLVEVNSDGEWWCRQINSDNAGTIYDLDLKVANGVVEHGHFIDSIIWGDVHVALMAPEQRSLIWGDGGLLDSYNPRRQFLHDILDFRARSHHEVHDPMLRFIRHTEGTDDVEREVASVSDFLESAERPWCETIIVNSNHDRHLGRWLKESDGRWDPLNAVFWTALWRSALDEMRNTGAEPNYLRLALEEVAYEGSATILDRDASYVVCQDDAGGIECGLHGDEGPNGSRGGAVAFARMGRRMCVAHSHRAGIVDGVYTVGTHSVLRPDYVHGPDAWSHTFCIVYENGKRTLVTIWKGKERA